VIVRISGESVYELADADHGELNDLDDAVVAAVEAGDEEGFTKGFARLLDFVRDRGTALPSEDLRPSDVILPPADLSFAEAGSDFTGDGLVPDPAPAA
jgi:hypothetical protein